MNDSFTKLEPIKRSNSMFLHPSPDIDIKVIKQVGDYSLGIELGSGAFGKVVLGKHILTNELVAIKILDKTILSHTPDDYQSVKQEISILKSVKHKHIVQLYDVLQTSRHIFIIMEYCEGKDLLDYILTKSKLSEEESLKYFQQLINALFYLHSQNIAHRDIKIDNMLLDRNRDLKLVDFGLSTKYPDDNLLDQPCGTVVYAAPEVLQGREYHGMLADVWSSGIVLYGMLSGYLPFGEQDDDINRDNIINGRIKIPSFFSDCVKDLLMHMLDLDPMTRFTLQEVRSHPWFNLIDYKLIPGIIIGYNIIPVDEKILNLCVTYNCDKEKVRESVINNKYNSESALYYLLIKKLQKKGLHSVSDFCSDEFISFVLDDNNLIENKYYERNNNIQESEIKYNININANNNCSAPPDGKLRCKEQKKENNEKNDNQNLITPKSSQNENINKKINFDESPKGVLSFIINTPSFQETNKELFNMKSSNSNNDKNTQEPNTNNNDIDSKKTNKNTSSDSKQKYYSLQTVNVNDFQIIDEKHREKLDTKIINKTEFNNKLISNSNNNNNIFDDNNQKEVENNNNNLLNVFYYNTDNNDKQSLDKENENKNENKTEKETNTLKNNIFDIDIDINNLNDLNNINLSNSNNNNRKNGNNYIDNSIEIVYDKSNESKLRNRLDILETPIISNKKLDTTEENNTNKENINMNINKEFIIETPPNNKNANKENNTNNNEDKYISKNKNTLSKQKVYIDKNKTYSEKNKNEDKNNLDINKIKDIRKINLFQEEIKEETKEKNQLILSSISEKELNDNKTLNKNKSTPLKTNNNDMVGQISLLTGTNNEIPPQKKDEENNSILLKENTIKENQKEIFDNININNEILKQKTIDKDNNNDNNNKDLKEDKDIKKEEKITDQIENDKKKIKNNNNNKIYKKKETNINKIKNELKKKKNPIIETIIKNYKAILDNNRSTEIKRSKKSKSNKSKDNNSNNYSSKRKLGKKSEKEIISIKVIINKNLMSKDKSKKKNSKSKNKTEKQGKKIKSIYKINVPPNNLSKTKYSTINKKPTTSIFKKKNIKNQTNKKPNFNGSSHVKSSSIHIFGAVAKNDKNIRKSINATCNHSNSLFKTTKINKNKNKDITNSKCSNKNKIKKVIKNNLLIKSYYNNKYMKLFKTNQYKNNNIILTNKIDKTNLNKKFDEIAHKINKSTKVSKNKYEQKKLPLWKYIQSDQYLNSNNSKNQKISSSPNIHKNERKNGIKIIREKVIKQNSYENRLNINNNHNKNIKLKDITNISVNINKLNNFNNKSASISKDKNINVFFINIKNYINNKNENNKKTYKNYIESSVAANHRYRSPYEIRELSESEKNKYLNQKTRYTKIPWKIKKKALDEKINIEDLYKLYMNKNKNPFKKNNKKIHNIKPVNNNISNNKNIRNQILLNINNFKEIKYNNYKMQNGVQLNDKYNLKKCQNFLLTNKKNEFLKSTNKKYNQSYTPQYIHKKSYFSSLNYMKERNIFPNKLFHSSNNHSENKKNNNNNMIYKNYSFIFDLSCLFVKSENINDCYQNLINKLIKKNIYFVQKPNKTIRCFKNGEYCEIKIVKLEQTNNNDNDDNNKKNVYCFRVLGKKGYNVNKMFKNIILG